MTCNKIMLIRHAERPSADKSIRGVGLDGYKDKESLSVRGWQRAGAFVRFFAPFDGRFLHPALARPKILYACKAAPEDPSLRPQMTLVPLADLLGIECNCDFFHGQETALVKKVLSSQGPALIAWKHDAMHVIANLMLGEIGGAPLGTMRAMISFGCSTGREMLGRFPRSRSFCSPAIVPSRSADALQGCCSKLLGAALRRAKLAAMSGRRRWN